MPHLSPMNWILAMFTLWLMLLWLMTSSWWSQFTFMKFNLSLSPNKSKSNSSNKWKW